MVTKIQARNIDSSAISANKLSSNLYVTLTSTGSSSDFLATAAFNDFNSSLVYIDTITYANSNYYPSGTGALNTLGDYVIIKGNNFTTGTQVLVGQTPATAVTYVNSSTLHVQVPSNSSGFYEIYVVNSYGSTSVKPRALLYSNPPTWVTSTELGTVSGNSNINGTLVATGATSYVNTTSLPIGLNLISANGYYYGNVVLQNSNTFSTSFTVNAINAENLAAPRTFNVTFVGYTAAFTVSPSVYSTTRGLSLSSWVMPGDGDLVLNTAGTWTITPTMNFTSNIKMWGGGGGTSTPGPGGGGGASNGAISFTNGTVYHFTVGQGGGGVAANRNAGGGGGGTGIEIVSNNTRIMIAGGGGGGYFSSAGGAGGGSSGQQGSGTGSAPGGGGGTQSAAGAGGVGTRRTGASGSGRNGGGLATGSAATRTATGIGTGAAGAYNAGDAGSGAGGGGYFGGGEGGGDAGGAPGGGGSGYINPTYVTNGTTTTGSGGTAALSSDADRGTSGSGGVDGTNGTDGVNASGKDGKIVIKSS